MISLGPISRRSFLVNLAIASPLLRAEIFRSVRYARTYALVIGIDRYDSAQIPSLNGCVLDARGVVSILTDPAIGIVSSKDCVVLLNNQATRANILSSVKKIRDALVGEENFLLYYSGHATAGFKDDVSLISSDARVRDIKDISIEAEIIPLACNDRGFFILIGDGCSIGNSLVGRINDLHPKVGVLSASKDHQAAFEWPQGGGVMTQALLKALSDSESDLDGDGLISLEEAYNRVYREVLTSLRDKGMALQNPSISGQFVNKMVIGRASFQALNRRRSPEQMVATQLTTVTWRGLLDVQSPYQVSINGIEEPQLEIHEDTKQGLVTFLGPPGVVDRLKSGANSLSVSGKTRVQAARDSFLLFKEEKGNLLVGRSPFARSYAVIIAVSDYAGTGYPNADGMVELAQKLSNDLTTQGFQVKPFYNKQATTAAVDDYLRLDLGPKLRPDDRVLLYYGGHGETLKGPSSSDVGYLVTSGTARGSVQAHGLPMRRIRSEYMDLLPAKHVLVLLDACFSGLSLLGPPPSEDDIRQRKLSRYREIDALASARMRAILTAGRKGDRAINENGGLFTRTLQEAMKGTADYDQNGVVTLEELYCYLWTKVSDSARAQGYEQQPQMEKLTEYGDGSFLFLYR